MTNEEFDALVARLEEEARRNPGGYQRRVLLLALAGNAYLAAMVLLLAGGLLGLLASLTVLGVIAVKLILVLAPFLWLLLKALRIKVEPPQGIAISPRQAPDLLAMIDELRRALQAPAFHHVLITDQFNAGVVQLPRLGIFGWPSNYLLLGLPLMKALTVDQFRAVLAHELGHLAKSHGRLSNWIYRQRLRWGRLLAALEARGQGGILFRPFLQWYGPYFNAYSFPLARANEYEADATARRLTSAQALAEALTAVNVLGSYLEERFWPHIHRQADELPQPGFAPYASLGHRVAAELDEESSRHWLEQAMARPTSWADSHPSLAERLGALGTQPKLNPPPPGQGADRLLGSSLDTITSHLDRSWEEEIRPAWEERHRQVQEGRRRLAELDGQVADGKELDLRDAFERAKLTESVADQADAALDQFRQLHRRAPDDPLICLSLGSRLLARDDDSGRALVERAMALDEEALLRGCELLRDYCWRRGREEEAHDWHRRLVERSEVQRAADQERNTLNLGDKFEASGLPAATLARLREELRSVPGLRKAYYLKKRVRHLPHRPCYVLAYSVTGLFRLHSRKRAAEVLQGIRERVIFPGETLIINMDGDNYRFGRKFRWLRSARLV